MSASRPEIAGQHMLGGLFRPRGNDRQVADDLLRGTLRLDNHPPAQIDIAAPDWLADPFGDNNWQFSFHSLRWLDVLRRSHEATGDQRYLDACVGAARSWHEAHTAGSAAKVSRFAWYDMGAGLRVLVLAGLLHTVGEQPWLVDCIAEHGRRMAPEEFGHQIGNHIIHIHNGLITAGHLMDEPAWTEMATHRLKKLLVENVDLDGVADDGAIQYQINNYNWYKEALDHARAAGITHGPEFDRVDLMPEFLVHAYQTTKTLVQFGDSDRTTVPRIEYPQLEHLRAGGSAGERPYETYRCYRSAGYAFGRTHWDVGDMSDVLHYSLRFGPPQSAHTHAHQDGGGVTVDFGGTELHPEGGRYRYDTQPMSVYFASQLTHNTVLILEDEFDPGAPTDLLRSETSATGDLTVVRRTEQHGSVWHRAVHHHRPARTLTVTDHVAPHRRSDVVQLWQLPRGAVVRVAGQEARVLVRGRHVATLTSAGTSPIYHEVVEGRRSSEHIQGWRSVKYGECFAAPVLRIGMTVDRGLLTTVVQPRRDGMPDAQVSLVPAAQGLGMWATTMRGDDVASARYGLSQGRLVVRVLEGL